MNISDDSYDYSVFANKIRRIFNARSTNLSFHGTGTKYAMVWICSGSINRDQSLFPGCVDIPFFFILVIDMEKSEDERYNSSLPLPPHFLPFSLSFVKKKKGGNNNSSTLTKFGFRLEFNRGTEMCMTYFI